MKWAEHEAFCKVAWSTEEVCGVAFDRPLKRDVLAETLNIDAPPPGPVAAFGNIPIGKKRARPQLPD